MLPSFFPISLMENWRYLANAKNVLFMQSAQSEGVRPEIVELNGWTVQVKLVIRTILHLDFKPDDPLQLLHVLLLTLVSLTERPTRHPRPSCEYPTWNSVYNIHRFRIFRYSQPICENPTWYFTKVQSIIDVTFCTSQIWKSHPRLREGSSHHMLERNFKIKF